MKLLLEGKEIICEGYTLNFSLLEYFPYIEIISPAPVLNKLTLETDTASRDMVFVNTELMPDRKWKTTMYPIIYKEVIKKIFPAVKGEFTTEEILQSVGFPTHSYFKTEKVYWEIPKLSFKEFIRHLELHTKVLEGGGCFLSFTLDGRVQIMDLKDMFSRTKGVLKIAGTPINFKATTNWALDYKGKYHFKQYTPEELIESDLILEKDLGEDIIINYISDKKQKDLIERYYKNLFYRRFYFTTQCQVESQFVTQPALSGKVEINGVPYLIAGLSIGNSGRTKYNLISF